MDAFYIYTEKGRKLLEQIFANDINAEATQEEVKGILLGSNPMESSNCTVISSGDDESIIRKPFEGKFIFLIKKDSLYFVILKKDENNPVMTIEVIREIVELFKKFFNREKLSEDIITNNYSVVIFLINEILAQGGKPNVFVNEILKNLVAIGSGLLNETLKYTPGMSNIRNLLALGKNVSGENKSKGVKINHSYNNGTTIHSQDKQNVFWRTNNVSHVNNKICVEIRENVNCVLTRKNKIIHFSIQGNVHVHCSIKGSPLIKMIFNRDIKLHLTHLHYTANYSLIVKRRLRSPDAEKNSFFFVPLNESYIIMQYVYYFPLKPKKRGVHSTSASSSVSTAPELTNVLNLTNDNSTQSVPAILDKNTQEGNNQVEKKNDEVTQENHKKEEELKNEKREISPAEDRFRSYMEEKKKPIPEKPLHRSNNQVVTFSPTLETTHNVEQKNGNIQPSTDNDGIIVIRDTLPCVRNNERYLLPIKVKGVITYTPNEYKYNIKLQLILNDIKRNCDSDMKITGYANISVKIPVYNFIKYVNIICTVGTISYIEKCNSVFWCIDKVENSDIDLSAELTLFIQPNPDGTFCSHRYYYEKFVRYNNDAFINGLPDTSRGNGISNCSYRGAGAKNLKIMRGSDGSSIFSNHLAKWLNIDAGAYPDFSFPVYVSFTVIGITASGKRVERVELKRPSNASLQAVYRYCTTYNHVEFRI
ncbi:hypothetical protein C922_00382 [Plasmodium inui San Antonio 1]|uniref:MHD domain-containing protein n=1 Tax=Plasmodium inui San Antonio 1 TaxID=1237626 RepID=W7AL79_9APIC|nr:hypothetical protein C922_00382 [Plasmodium inui San Antonio 1]EUD69519.1 hypothetical protein C922_00382 [Plasmodium inui San Antonio 1]